MIIFKCTQMLKFIARVLDQEATLGDGLRPRGHMFMRGDSEVTEDGRADNQSSL